MSTDDQAIVLRWFADHPGASTAEYAKELAPAEDFMRYQYIRSKTLARLKSLEKYGLAESRTTPKGPIRKSWRVTPAGIEWLRGLGI